MQSNSNNISIAALICGILGLIGGWIPVVVYFTLVLSILAIVFGVKGRKMAQADGAPTGMATAGMVLGIISVAFSAVMIVCTVVCVGALAAAGSLSIL